MDCSQEVRYLTDDRDYRQRNELVITQGNNGDWYVAVVPEGEVTIGRGVRLCTSGGASSRVPGLTRAIFDAFTALQHVLVAREEGEGMPRQHYDDSRCRTCGQQPEYDRTGWSCECARCDDDDGAVVPTSWQAEEKP